MANTQGRLLLLMVAQSGLKSEKKCNLGNILTASKRGLIEEKKSNILMHNFFFTFWITMTLPVGALLTTRVLILGPPLWNLHVEYLFGHSNVWHPIYRYLTMLFKERVNMYLYSIYILHGAIECIVCLCSVLNSTLLYFTSKMRCFDRNVVAFLAVVCKNKMAWLYSAL